MSDRPGKGGLPVKAREETLTSDYDLLPSLSLRNNTLMAPAPYVRMIFRDYKLTNC